MPIDLTDELAAEEKEVIQVTTDGGPGELSHTGEIIDEGFEFLEHLFTVGQVVIVELPSGGPLGHQAHGLLEGGGSRGVGEACDGWREQGGWDWMGGMMLMTLLNRCYRFKGFVYQSARFAEGGHKAVEVQVRARSG